MIYGKLVLFACLFKVSLSIIYEEDTKRNFSNQDGKDITGVSLDCPGGQWRKGTICVPCRTECPELMYIGKKCSATTDSQCVPCEKVVIYYSKPAKYGGSKSETWYPRDIEDCEKVNRHNTTVGYVLIVVFIFVGLVLSCLGCLVKMFK